MHTTHKLTKLQRQEIIDLYKTGEAVSSIASKYNITTSNIFYLLKQASVKCTGVIPKKQFSRPKAQKLCETNRICDYGCNTLALYIFNNGRVCCSNNPNKCYGKIQKIQNTQSRIDKNTGLTIRYIAAKKSLETRTQQGITKTSQIKGAYTRIQSGFYDRLRIRMRDLWEREPWSKRFRIHYKNYKQTDIPYQGSYEYAFLQQKEDEFGIVWVQTNIKRGPAVKYVYKGIEHIYLPDFIVDNNIYEIKSKYTWKIDKEKNCIKLAACKKLGYNVIVVINKKELNIEQARLI